MSKPNEDALSRYVRGKVREQHLSRRDVSVRSGGLIAESYVGAIMNGTCTNVSVDKLKALAKGIGGDEMELARVAFGDSTFHPRREPEDAEAHSLILVDLQRKTVLSADVAEITRQLMQLSQRERGVVLQFVKKLARSAEKQRVKRRA